MRALTVRRHLHCAIDDLSSASSLLGHYGISLLCRSGAADHNQPVLDGNRHPSPRHSRVDRFRMSIPNHRERKRRAPFGRRC